MSASDLTILAIDPGTACGWAVRHRAGTYDSGVWLLRPNRWRNMGAMMLRLRLDLTRMLSDLTSTQYPPVDLVAFEEVRRHLGVDAAHVYGAIMGVVCEVCETHKLAYEAFPVGTIKKHATGSGRASKDDMLVAARERWPGYAWQDDNEVDARWLADCAYASLIERSS
ncbi:unnamed protein product [marine sediment metagenome]|uniref:Holliday junction nuclease RuvC n=1 Tax=marine sediment metagenome TaxID=412755 RepID=X0TC38_9ZZZZ